MTGCINNYDKIRRFSNLDQLLKPKEGMNVIKCDYKFYIMTMIIIAHDNDKGVLGMNMKSRLHPQDLLTF